MLARLERTTCIQIGRGITYYACAYRISYGDKAAEALGHGKWQYVREDMLLDQIDRFFATNIFGPTRLAAFRSQHRQLAREVTDAGDEERERVQQQLADIATRIERQIAAIEAGVEPSLVRARIDALKTERSGIATALTALTPTPSSTDGVLDVNEACTILDGPPRPHRGARQRRRRTPPPRLRRLPARGRVRPQQGSDTTEGARLERLHGSDDLQALVDNWGLAGRVLNRHPRPVPPPTGSSQSAVSPRNVHRGPDAAQEIRNAR
jgi:hypothetical protein